MKPTDLTEHPEGGRFREVFRSDAVVTNSNGDARSALTHIYFSLNKGEVSRFHKVQSEPLYHRRRNRLRDRKDAAHYRTLAGNVAFLEAKGELTS